MNLYYQIYVYDKNEKLKHKTRKMRSRSFLKPFLYRLCYLVGGTAISTLDIDGVGHTSFGKAFRAAHPGKDSRSESYAPSLGTSDRVGIQVGTGTAAVAITDYAINAKIVNGTGSGQFIYYGCWVLGFTVGASSVSFDIERIFKNSSGDSVTVNETGLYDADVANVVHYNYCLIRDKLSSGVAVANGEYLKVKYTITVSV